MSPFEMADLPADECDVLVAVVNEGTEALAAASLGIPAHRVKFALERIRDRLGARNTTHAAVLAYPLLANRYRESARGR